MIHLRIGLQIDPCEQSAVSGQEIADAESVLRITRPDHPQTGEILRLTQKLPASDERLEDDIAQAGALVERAPERGRGNLIDFAIAAGNSAHDGWEAREVRDIAGELPFAVNHDRLRRVTRVVDDLDLARLDDEELEIALADGE